MPTDLLERSKCDTVLLLDPAGDIFTDFSQERTDLNENLGDYIFEWPSARAALTEPRELLVMVDLRSTYSGILLNHGSGGSIGFRISLSSSVISCSDSGGPIVTATMPGMVSGTSRRCLISWCTRLEGATAIHELLLYNFATDSYAFSRATSGAGTTDPSWNLTVNGNDTGAGGLAPGIDLYTGVRIGRRFHSTTEQIVDYVSEGGTFDPDDARVRNPMLTMAGLPIPNEAEFAGPSYLWAGANNASCELRTTSPLVNMRPLVPAVEDNTYSPQRYFRKAPAPDQNFRWSTRYLRTLAISPKHNKARVRVFIQVYNLGEDGPTTIFMRCYSALGLPLKDQPVEKLKFSRSPTTNIFLSHGEDGLGEWVDLGILPLTRESAGDVSWWETYVMLGFYIDPSDDVAEADTYFKIKAWTVEPFRDDSDGGGFDQNDEKKGK